MLNFKGFIIESKENSLDGEMGMPKQLHNFMWHLSSPSMHPDNGDSVPDYTHGKVPLHESVISEEAMILIMEGPFSEHPKLKKLGVVYSGGSEKDAYHPHNIVREGIKAEIAKRAQHNTDNETRKKKGEAEVPYANIHKRISDGFDAAFNDNEDHKTRTAKAKESVAHFHKFMHEHGGHAKDNKLDFMGQNGKTASSSSDGRNTIGASLAPHTVGSKDPYGQVKCHGHHHNSCPNASEECKENCLGLNAGGNRQYPEASLRSKVLRQRYLMEHPEHAARVMSHEIKKNEEWTNAHHTIHNEHGHIIGYQNKKSGKIKSETYKKTTNKETGEETHTGDHPDDIKAGLESGKHTKRNIESGVRLNVTSDIQWHKMGGGKLFKHHPNTKFYDYTKNVSSTKDKLPDNYNLALSHTGDDHKESNSHHVVEHLRNGGVSAMVFKRGKDQPQAKRVKVIGSHEGHDEYHVANGDDDDNIDHRHQAAAEHHEAQAAEHRAKGNHREAEHHDRTAQEYRAGRKGVVSGLELKGVTNDKAGKFANEVDNKDAASEHHKILAQKHRDNGDHAQAEHHEKLSADYKSGKKKGDGTIWLHEHPHGGGNSAPENPSIPMAK